MHFYALSNLQNSPDDKKLITRAVLIKCGKNGSLVLAAVHADDAQDKAEPGPEQIDSAITGPSGCGKSTLLKLLLGWLPEYSGAIRFDGKDARYFTPEQLQLPNGYTNPKRELPQSLEDLKLLTELSMLPCIRTQTRRVIS